MLVLLCSILKGRWSLLYRYGCGLHVRSGAIGASHRVRSMAENSPVFKLNRVPSPVFNRTRLFLSMNSSIHLPFLSVVLEPQMTLLALKSPRIIRGLGICGINLLRFSTATSSNVGDR